jgi:hypothetical protein
MEMSTGARVCRRLTTLVSLRQPHEQVWSDCYNYSHPIRGSGFNGEVYDAVTAKRKIAELLDTTSTDASRTLASNIVGGMTPANSRWFEPDVGESSKFSDEDKRWLGDASQTLFENIHSANFDSVGYECMLDMVDAGWFGMYIEEKEGGGLFFQLWHISELYIAASKPGGVIDTVYRKFTLTVEQAVNEYGLDNVGDALRKDYQDEKYDNKYEFIHAIEPRKMHVPNARMAKNLPIASYHVEVKSKTLVRESGYHEMPVIVPRWALIPSSDYAVGPVLDALPAIKELCAIKRMELAACDLAISGMWLAVDDGVLNAKSIKVGPRKVIVANDINSMKELKSGADFNVAFTKEESLQAEIRKILMADQLQPQDGPAMTATEVHVRVGLIRQLLGPVYGRLQAEYLQPLITRCFGLAYRAGVFGEAPEALRGHIFAIKYISPLARAQKLEDVTAIERAYAMAGQISQLKGGDMAVFDNLDDDEAIRLAGSALGIPEKIKRTSDNVVSIREARAEAQQAAQEDEQANAIEQTAVPALLKQAVAA